MNIMKFYKDEVVEKVKIYQSHFLHEKYPTRRTAIELMTKRGFTHIKPKGHKNETVR